jgi:predicted dehydrogenase
MGADQLGVVIAGCGDLTQRAILLHLSQPDVRRQVRVVGLYDPDASRAQAAAARFHVAAVAGDFAELLDLPEGEMVIVASPMAVHAEQAIAALKSGKHLYLQKPLATTPADADRLLAAAAQSRSKVLVAPVQRLCPAYCRINDAIEQGEIGPVFWALTANHQPLAPGLDGQERSWLTGRDAGPVRDTTLYSLTLLTDLFGPVERVACASGRRLGPADSPLLADDNTVLILEFREHVLAVATGSYAAGGRLVPAGFLGVYGSCGSIETTRVDPLTWLPTQIEVRARKSDGTVEDRAIDCPLCEVPHLGGRHAELPEAQVHADIMHLVRCILEDTPPLPTLAQARHLVDVIDKATLAARTGVRECIESRFPWPAATEK